MHKPVVIIGGGLAGLYAAYSLKKRDIPFLVATTKSDLKKPPSTPCATKLQYSGP